MPLYQLKGGVRENGHGVHLIQTCAAAGAMTVRAAATAL